MTDRSVREEIQLQNSWAPNSRRLPHFTVLTKVLPVGIERFDHRALPTRFRDNAHDARPVAQQRTDGWAQGIPPNPRSFLFHMAIYHSSKSQGPRYDRRLLRT